MFIFLSNVVTDLLSSSSQADTEVCSEHLLNASTRSKGAIKELNIFELYKDDQTNFSFEDDLHAATK